MTRSTPFADPPGIELIIFDVDGVLTDGSININDDGSETKRFNVKDGYGFRICLDSGYQIAIITGRVGEALKHRLRSLRVDDHLVIQGAKDKSESLDLILERTGIDVSKIAYMGDDCPDLPAIERVGYPMCPNDAVPEVRDACAWISTKDGGMGAAREAISHLLSLK